jgi:hypothetical protein
LCWWESIRSWQKLAHSLGCLTRWWNTSYLNNLLRVCLSCALLFVEWPQAASPLSRTLQPASHDPMVRSVFVSHNNKGRQRVYIDSHYLDNIDNNAVIINVHLCSHSEHNLSVVKWQRTLWLVGHHLLDLLSISKDCTVYIYTSGWYHSLVWYTAASGRLRPSPPLSSYIVIYLRHNVYSLLLFEEPIHNTPLTSHIPRKQLSSFLNANTLDIPLILSCLQWFCQTVCKHLICRLVLQLNDVILDELSDIVSTNVDMLSTCVELWIFGKGESPLIVSIDCRWLILSESKLS